MSPSFLADRNLGKLCKLLRMMGLDCRFLETSDPNTLISVARKEKRLILTRKRKFPENLYREVLIIADEIPYNQAKEVVSAFNIDPLENAFTRCIECNTPLEKVSKDEIRGKIPSFIFKTREEFYKCPTCGKIFWKGTHKKDMQETLQRIKEEAFKPPEV